MRPRSHEDLAFHIIGEHCNAAAINPLPFGELISFHYREHHGPCGIRNHSAASWDWNAEKIEQVLEEAEEDVNARVQMLSTEEVQARLRELGYGYLADELL